MTAGDRIPWEDLSFDEQAGITACIAKFGFDEPAEDYWAKVNGQQAVWREYFAAEARRATNVDPVAAGYLHPGDVLFRDLLHGVAMEIARGWELDVRDAGDVFDGMTTDQDRWSVLCCAKDRLAVQRRWRPAS